MSLTTEALSTLPFWTTALGLYALLRSGGAWRLAIDKPNQRSLHVRPTPRVGGVVLVPAFLTVWIVASLADTLLVLLVAGLCAMSFFDDRAGISIILRFGGHLAVAVMFVLFGLDMGHLFWSAIAILALVWLTNLYNFMDGSDGLAGGMALLGFSAYAWVAASLDMELSCACWSVAAAAGGFLLFNFPPAKVFMGDAGSIPLGFLAAAFGMLGWQRGIWPAWFPVLVFSPFVVDASVTLLRRILRQERFWQAHREHYYQRLIRMGWGHRRTAWSEYMLMAGVTASAVAGLRLGTQAQMSILIGWTMIYAGMMLAIDVLWRRFMHSPGEGA
ncbi:MAG: glycosyltransferase family 4 protein [Sterolibacterium sp.]|nr:glycosyltransferase family 4 protein [Sterolibacterium sp.]